MFCPNCGNQIPEGAKFCASCGKPMAVYAPEVAAEAVPAEITPPQKKKKKAIGIIAGITAAAVAIAAVAGWFLFARKETVNVLVSIETDYSSRIFEYDKSGNLIYEHFQMKSNPRLQYIVTREFDEAGNMISQEASSRAPYTSKTCDWSYDKDLPETLSISSYSIGIFRFEYNKNGELIRVFNEYGESQANYLELDYDQKGRVVEEFSVSGSYGLYGDYVYKYNYTKRGDLACVKHYKTTQNGKELYRTTEYTYNFAGDVIEIIRTNADGEKIYSAKKEYDWRGRLTSKTVKNNGKKESFTYTYDKKANTISVCDQDNNVTLYKYAKLKLSKANATRARLQQQAQIYNIGANGDVRGYDHVAVSLYGLFDAPITPELKKDPLLS